MRYLVALMIVCGLASAKPSAGETSSTGALDFDLVHRASGAFVIKDAAYEVALPAKPSFKSSTTRTPTGSSVSAMTASVTLAAGDTIVFSVVVMPDDAHLDAAGLTEMAADQVRGTGAKVTANTETTLAGLPARKVLGTGTYAGKPFQLIEYVSLDAKHRAVVGLSDLSAHSPDPAYDAARKTFTVKSGPAPHPRAKS